MENEIKASRQRIADVLQAESDKFENMDYELLTPAADKHNELLIALSIIIQN
jgi:hypothetical protein